MICSGIFLQSTQSCWPWQCRRVPSPRADTRNPPASPARPMFDCARIPRSGAKKIIGSSSHLVRQYETNAHSKKVKNMKNANRMNQILWDFTGFIWILPLCQEQTTSIFSQPRTGTAGPWSDRPSAQRRRRTSFRNHCRRRTLKKRRKFDTGSSTKLLVPLNIWRLKLD